MHSVNYNELYHQYLWISSKTELSRISAKTALLLIANCTLVLLKSNAESAKHRLTFLTKTSMRKHMC